jgi:hypothetical protein
MPEIRLASSDARNATASAMSSGSQFAPSSSQDPVRVTSDQSIPDSESLPIIGVFTPPGQIALMRTPEFANSRATALVNPITACLEAH